MSRTHCVLGRLVAVFVLAFSFVGCSSNDGGSGGTPTVSVSGRSIVVTGGDELRGLVLDLRLVGATADTVLVQGKDAARLNLFRATIVEDRTTARVLLTDSRKIALPASGEIATLGGSGVETFIIESAQAAGPEGEDVAVKVVP